MTNQCFSIFWLTSSSLQIVSLHEKYLYPPCVLTCCCKNKEVCICSQLHSSLPFLIQPWSSGVEHLHGTWCSWPDSSPASIWLLPCSEDLGMADHECLVVMALLPWLPPPTPPVNQKDGSSTSVEKSSRAPRRKKKEERSQSSGRVGLSSCLAGGSQC